MSGIRQTIVGLTVALLICGFTLSPARADSSSDCRDRGHAYGMARHGMAGHGGGSGHLLHRLLTHQQELGLTQEQITKIRSVALQQDRERIRAQADVQVADRELRSLMWDEKTALTDLEAKVKERVALEAKVEVMDIKARRAVLELLTPEQRDKLKAMRMERTESQRHRADSSDGVGAPESLPAPGLQAS
jgi:protein CpxP